MKTFFVKDLEVGKEITDFFMAKKAQIKTGSNGKDYFERKRRSRQDRTERTTLT